jgi:hypothetical protein
MRIIGFSYGANEPLFTHILEVYGVSNNRYDGRAMKAIDDAGLLELYQKDDDSHVQTWHCSRPTKGNQVFYFEASSKGKLIEKPPPGGRIERRDLDGGMTAGVSFIPLGI